MTVKILLFFTLYLMSGLNCADQIKTGVSNEWKNPGRFSLFDNTRAAEFWVLIRELTVEDSGTYQCGVDIEKWLDNYTPVKLKISEEPYLQKSITVNGHVGGSVNISYNYPQSFSSKPKFLCRRVGSVDCNYNTSVNESRRWIKEGNISLFDDRANQTFTVNFSTLTEEDSGEYWCGAESDWESDHGYKVYITQINLTVTDPDVLPQSSTPTSLLTKKPLTLSTSKTALSSSSVAGAAPSASFVITILAVILMLVLIGLLFFTVTLRKRRNTQDPASTQDQSIPNSLNNSKISHTVYDYEEIEDTRRPPASDTGVYTVYSTAHLPTTPANTTQTAYDNVQLPTSPFNFSNPVYSTAQQLNPPDQDIYSTAQLPISLSDSSENDTHHSAGKSAEDPAYAIVNFSKNDAVTTANINKEDSCDYAIVKHVSGSD
ncbi:uncharacterized protein [Salminus brasiliensis]|uniref:uncharacterized protein n=1 Tax=Salminus brasiliensis TaxID=930266 RepID=UPI003B838083